jgi:RHH-type proline utilization regulon transcriptional repressor/proline dehydrogenase/delta 1-pyrroline-5-carboxylate dehydrogenase
MTKTGAGSPSAASAQLDGGIDERALQAEIDRIGREIAAAERPSAVRHPARAVDRRAMALASRDDELRIALFRLIDVTPACRTAEDLGRHLASFAGELEPSRGLAAALRLADTRAGRTVLGGAVAAAVRHTAHRFIAGETPHAAAGELGERWRAGIAASVDLLGEATVSSEEADAYAARCAGTLDELADLACAWPAQALLDRDSLGALPRANLSVKVSSLTAMLRAQAPERGVADAATRLRPLLARARDLGAHLHVDMESLDALETTVELALELLEEPALADGPSAGLVVQAYLRDSPALVERILAWAARTRRRQPLTVRLVKGAYWDHEVAEAVQHGWSVPVFTDKAACDRNFEVLTRRLLDARPLVRVAIGSHNLRSVAHAIAGTRLRGGRDDDLELQVLRGLGDELATALARRGTRVRVYAPVGDLVAGMAYLVRRLLENTSNESFLLAQEQGVPLERLLAAP